MKSIQFAIVFISLFGIQSWGFAQDWGEATYENKTVTEWIKVYESPLSSYPDQLKALKVFKALGLKAKKAVPTICRGLRHPELELRQEASNALFEMGDAAKAAIPALIQTLKDENARLRSESADLLGGLKSQPKIVVPALIKALEDKVLGVQLHSIVALTEFGKAARPAIPALIHCFESKNQYTRRYAIHAVVKLNVLQEELIPALRKELKREPWFDRSEAVERLGDIAQVSKRAFPLIILALNDRNNIVRGQSFRVLKSLGKKAGCAAPALLKIVKNEKAGISDRWQAIDALGSIGTNKEDVIPALFKILDHKSAGLRLASVETLHKLGAKSPRFMVIAKALLTHEDQEIRYFAEDVLRILKETNEAQTGKK